MTRKYRVEAVSRRAPVSHLDFISPRNAVTLVRVEDGRILKLLFPTKHGWSPGDLIDLDDFHIATLDSA